MINLFEIFIDPARRNQKIHKISMHISVKLKCKQDLGSYSLALFLRDFIFQKTKKRRFGSLIATLKGIAIILTSLQQKDLILTQVFALKNSQHHQDFFTVYEEEKM